MKYPAGLLDPGIRKFEARMLDRGFRKYLRCTYPTPRCSDHKLSKVLNGDQEVFEVLEDSDQEVSKMLDRMIRKYPSC